jgi:ribosomal protein S18 acetylase RimI-like enzyme
MKEEIPDYNLFMICNSLNTSAITELPEGYHVRFCRKDEVDIWKRMPFDTPELATQYHHFMTEFFNQVYLPYGDLFFKRCLFVCDESDTPIGTCFLWKAYNVVWTVHWFKVNIHYEGMGIGRSLLSYVMQTLSQEEYPVFLHTHPTSYRAIKLYSDLGFKLLTDSVIGQRTNDLNESLPILKKFMPDEDFNGLEFQSAPEFFLDVVNSSLKDEF